MKRGVLFLLISTWLIACTEAPSQVQVWGLKGSAPGQFNEPFDIAVDQHGDVYVTDVRNRRVQKFDAEGRFLLAFGQELFEKPAGIGIGPDGSIWVTDYDLDQVFRFDSKGKLLVAWGEAGDGLGNLDVPADVAVSSRGFVYVVDEYHHRIQKFTPDGRLLLAWGEKVKVNVVISALNFLISDGNGGLYYPSRIAISPDDRIFVSDAYNNRIQVFDSQGQFQQSIGGLGVWGGRFRVSSGLAVAKDGSLLVADFYNNRIQHFNEKGGFLAAWGGEGYGSGQFSGPTGIALSPNGRLYVADWGNHRVQHFRP